MSGRQRLLDYAAGNLFDVAIVGGGISGAALYHALSRLGYRTLLMDKGDFAAGTSQSSGMMVWGGLLYLRQFDVGSVIRFSSARDALLRDLQGLATPSSFRYIPPQAVGLYKYYVLAGLYLYWLLGRFSRTPPVLENAFSEASLLRGRRRNQALRYEEGMLKHSDARFVLQWITPHQSPDQVPLNYCSLISGGYHRADRCWSLHLRDELGRGAFDVRARCVVNCAGVWTDSINRQFGIWTPYRHVLSKGVYLGLNRPVQHQSPLVFEMGEHGDVLTYVPWGPVSLWGPTETAVQNVKTGFSVSAEDVNFLLGHARKHLKSDIRAEDVVSLRCGIRPLAVEQSFRQQGYTLEISRSHRVACHETLPWISFFGGKMTNCMPVAREISGHVAGKIGRPNDLGRTAIPPVGAFETTTFPALSQPVPSPKWCMEHEFCHSLEDYLRRRTNIAQWVPREGLGRQDENLDFLRRAALVFARQDVQVAMWAVNEYRESVGKRFDAVLAAAA